MQPRLEINRIHHVSLIAKQPERTARFYVDLLGLHRADEFHRDDSFAQNTIPLSDGKGTLIAVSGSPDGAAGESGIGTVHHIALAVDTVDALLKWKGWLQSNDVLVYGPYDQQAYEDIIFVDPDGVLIEIATRGPGWEATRDGEEVYVPPVKSMAPFRDEAEIRLRTWPHPVTRVEEDMALQGFHHVSTIVSSLVETDRFYRDNLGMPLVRKMVDSDDPEVEQWYWGSQGGRPGSLITAFPIVHIHESGPLMVGQAGIGVADHFALGANVDEQALRSWSFTAAGQGVSVETIPSHRHQSVAIHSPDRLTVELVATLTERVNNTAAQVHDTRSLETRRGDQ